jgi:hypothetical protein
MLHRASAVIVMFSLTCGGGRCLARIYLHLAVIEAGSKIVRGIIFSRLSSNLLSAAEPSLFHTITIQLVLF